MRYCCNVVAKIFKLPCTDNSSKKMVDEEIVAGLRNAVERGESVEQAKQSFFNAGYPENDVNEAASTLGSAEMKEIKEVKEIVPEAITEVKTSENKKSRLGNYILIAGAVIIILVAVVFMSSKGIIKIDFLNKLLGTQ